MKMKTMKNVIYTIAIIIGITSVLLSSSCANPPKTPDGQGGVRTITVDNTTSVSLTVTQVKPDRVELIYFHTKEPCHCMAVVKENLVYAVETNFGKEIVTGKVKLTTIVSDDPANAELVKKYDAMLFTLFIKEIRGNNEKVYPVSDIWNMTGDDNKDKLINFIRIKVNSVLEGKSS
jgi:hypothetical protein